MPLSKDQLQHRCLWGQGAKQCRYLTYGNGGQECTKRLSGRKKSADAKVEKIREDCKKNHVDPNNQWNPIGNGGTCQGYLYPDMAREVERLQRFEGSYDFSSMADQATFAEALQMLGRHLAVHGKSGSIRIHVGGSGIVGVEANVGV